MGLFQLVLLSMQYIPAIVKSVEEHYPNADGSEKKDIIVKQATSVPVEGVNNDQIVQVVSSVIETSVALFNKLGIFKHGNSPASPKVREVQKDIPQALK